jgi:opacity protein-like surface antigen
MKKTILLISAVLLAGTVSSAQSLALPKTDKPNFSASVAPTYLHSKLKTDFGDGCMNLYGATAAFAWNINRNNAIQADIGVQCGSDSEFGVTEHDIAVPLLFSYNFSLPFGANDRFEVSVSPAVGLAFLYTKVRVYSVKASDTDIALAYGIGLGFTYHADHEVFIKVAYRFLKMTDYSLFGVDGKFDTHALTIAIGTKF